MKIKFTLIGLILILELGVYTIVNSIVHDADVFYSLTSRYSARLSFFILSILAIWVTYKGLAPIFENRKCHNLFIAILVSFSINHLIHFYFLYNNFQVNNLNIVEMLISPGAFVYFILTLSPIYFWSITDLTKARILLFNGFIILMIGVCVFTYLTRFGRAEPLPMSPPMVVFKIFVIWGILLIGGLAWRTFNEYHLFRNKA